MKVLTYTTKEEENFFAFIDSVNFDNNSFFLVFAPYFILNESFIKKLEKKVSSEYVIVSTSAVLEKKEFKEDFIQGIFFVFEKKGYVNISYEENISLNFEKVASSLKEEMKMEKTNLIFSTASNVALNIIIDQIGYLDRKNFLVGGIASSNNSNFETKIVYNGKCIEDGFVIIHFGNVESMVSVSTGFIPVGPSYKITKSHLNKIYEIDGLSSYFFLEKILKGTGLKPEDLDMGKTSKYLWSFPFIIIDKAFGHITVCRTPKEYSQKESAFKFWGNFKTGDKVKISIGDPDDIIENTELDVKIFKYQLMEMKVKPDILLNFSCVARYELLKKSGLQNNEAKIFKRSFLLTPIAGMLTFGEIAPDKNEKKINFYNQTSVLVAMWEK